MLLFDPTATLRAALRLLQPTATGPRPAAPQGGSPAASPPSVQPGVPGARPAPAPAPARTPLPLPLPTPALPAGTALLGALQRAALLPATGERPNAAAPTAPTAATPSAQIPAPATALLLPAATSAQALMPAAGPFAMASGTGAATTPADNNPSPASPPVVAAPPASSPAARVSTPLPEATADFAGPAARSTGSAPASIEPAASMAAPPEAATAQPRLDGRAPVPAHVLLPDPDFLRAQAARSRPPRAGRRDPRRPDDADPDRDEAGWPQPGSRPDPALDERASSGQQPAAGEEAGEGAPSDDVTAGSEGECGGSAALVEAVRHALRAQAALAMRAQANVFAAQARDLLR